MAAFVLRCQCKNVNMIVRHDSCLDDVNVREGFICEVCEHFPVHRNVSGDSTHTKDPMWTKTHVCRYTGLLLPVPASSTAVSCLIDHHSR